MRISATSASVRISVCILASMISTALLRPLASEPGRCVEDGGRCDGEGNGDRPRVLTQAETEAVVRAALPDLVATPDSYLGRGLPLLADPGLRTAWEDVVSLGPPTKVRRITGREFPIWIALPEHEPALLASPFVARAQGLAGA